MERNAYKQDSRAYLEVSAIVADDSLEDLWVHQSAIEEGTASSHSRSICRH